VDVFVAHIHADEGAELTFSIEEVGTQPGVGVHEVIEDALYVVGRGFKSSGASGEFAEGCWNDDGVHIAVD
jgi:hypothetical protein